MMQDLRLTILPFSFRVPPVASDVLCATYVTAAGDSRCTSGSTLDPSATCGDDDECSQSECCIDGETS